MQKILIKNLKDLKYFSKKILEKLNQNFTSQDYALLIELSGDLGSGKTTFVQNIGKSLGIKEKINSPTFTISKIYKIPKNNSAGITNKKNLIHIDAYRLGEKNSLKNIGLDHQLKNPDNIIFIEWPEIIEKELNQKALKKIRLEFKYISQNEREISVSR